MRIQDNFPLVFAEMGLVAILSCVSSVKDVFKIELLYSFMQFGSITQLEWLEIVLEPHRLSPTFVIYNSTWFKKHQ